MLTTSKSSRQRKFLSALLGVELCVLTILCASATLLVSQPYTYSFHYDKFDNDIIYDTQVSVKDLIKYQHTFIESYTFDPEFDSLPEGSNSGSEVSAFTTLLRMNGYPIVWQRVSNMLEKSQDEYVYTYLGHPYRDGGLCMSPCIQNVGLDILENSPFKPVNLKKVDLIDLPTPCQIWVTENLIEPEYTGSELYGYKYISNSFCMVLTYISYEYGTVLDPSIGEINYSYELLNDAYISNGMQAIYIVRP